MSATTHEATIHDLKAAGGAAIDASSPLAELLADAERAINPPPSTMTLAETGWRRLSGACLRWISEPYPTGGWDVLELKGRGMNLVITTAFLQPDIDPDDEEAVTEALEEGWAARLPLPALVILRHGLTTAIDALEAAANVSISYPDDQPAKTTLTAVK